VPQTSAARGSAAGVAAALPPTGVALAYEESDAAARRIASRLKAVLDGIGLDLVLEAVGPGAVVRDPDGRERVLLVRHVAAVEDPILALQDLLVSLGQEGSPAWQALDGATILDEPEHRADAATSVERGLIEGAYLVPLVRLEAWVALAPGLAGLRVESNGALRFERARWVR
jgi:hypothetical protein